MSEVFSSMRGHNQHSHSIVVTKLTFDRFNVIATYIDYALNLY
jgi:hypothetical protein